MTWSKDKFTDNMTGLTVPAIELIFHPHTPAERGHRSEALALCPLSPVMHILWPKHWQADKPWPSDLVVALSRSLGYGQRQSQRVLPLPCLATDIFSLWQVQVEFVEKEREKRMNLRKHFLYANFMDACHKIWCQSLRFSLPLLHTHCFSFNFSWFFSFLPVSRWVSDRSM